MTRHAPEPSEAYHKQRAENRRQTNMAVPATSRPNDDVTVERDYEVIGKHAISGVKKGGTVTLPDGPQTDCLIESGHVKLKPVEKAPEEKAPVKSAPKKGTDNG